MSRRASLFGLGASRPSFHMAKAGDGYVWDDEGGRYLDLTSGWNVCNAGWNNRAIHDTCMRLCRDLPYSPWWCTTEPASQLAERLAELAPGYVAVPSCSGGEAIDNALKVARLVTGGGDVISLGGSFHGNTTGAALAAGFDVPHLASLGLQERGVRLAVCGDQQAVRDARRQIAAAEHPCAIVFETVTTNNGCEVLSGPFLRMMAQQAKAAGLLLICDEIGTGIFRTGPFLSCTAKGIRPDVIVCGKALTNGLYPLSLCLISKELASVLDVTAFTSTYGGTPAACAAALATLDYHRQSATEQKVRKDGKRLRRRMTQAFSRLDLVCAIRGEGFELAIELEGGRHAASVRPASLLARLRSRGLFAACSAGGHLMFMPPLTTDLDLLLDAVDRIAEVLEECVRR